MTLLALAPDETHAHKWPASPDADGLRRCEHCHRPKLKEAEFRRQIIDLANATGWEHVGFRPAQTKFGWRTPGTGTMAKGWPDLTLVHPRAHRLLFVELKGDGGRLDPEQERVLDVLRTFAATSLGVFVYAWWPDDLDEALRVLTP